MMRTTPGCRHTMTVAAMTALAACSLTASAQSNPDELLDRMNEAVKVLDYEGTVFRRENGESETLRIVRKIIDGRINEKLVSLEGNGLEIIRIGNEVHCILPDKKTVLIEEWADQSTLFSALPSSEIRYGAEYDVSVVKEDRVAGRRTVMLAIRPHDNFRYAHRIWLDADTSFPLKTEMVSHDGDLIEEIKFAEIEFGAGVSKDQLAPSMSLDNFSWFSEPKRYAATDIETAWQSTDLPPGFRAVSTTRKTLPGADKPVTHIAYSDGLANVSVFIADASASRMTGKANVGASNTYSLRRDNHLITVVGEVPAATVERIATSMQQN